MSDFFLGEIRMFSFGWAPQQWALCNGATLPIQQNAALYSLLGTAYGGDGRTTFQLPDLRGRAMVGYGSASGTAYNIGNNGGAETVTLTMNQIPQHSHAVQAASSNGTAASPNGALLAQPVVNTAAQPLYASASSNLTPLAPSVIAATAGQGHNNMQPYLVSNFCIATAGLYPMRP